MSDDEFTVNFDSDVDLKRRIVEVCSQFERQCAAGEAPRIEEFLEQIPDGGRARGLYELIAVEIQLRRKAGQIFDVDSYLTRFSDDESIVREAFELDGRCTVTDLRGGSTDEPAETGDPHQFASLPTRFDSDRIHKSLGRFQIERALGKGSFGIVYLAIDPQLGGRQVALKVPRLERVDTDDKRREFMRDAERAARLTHPGIVTIHDIATEEGGLFIVQEYMPGGDLKQRLRSDGATFRQAVAWMIPIADAVAFAHQKDIIHRDLKPANILLDERSQPRVADFGLALHESEQCSHRDEFAGTPAYMSPEQVRGESHRLDGRSDTWSLGIIFYEMLTGRLPFRGNEQELFDQIKHRDPRPPREIKPDVPVELERICLKCLAKPVAQRYSSAADLAQDLRTWQLSVAREEASQEMQKQGTARVVPKGLRSFDGKDAEFFLDLLPGPRDYNGLPECIRFWKTRVEETDPDHTFAVGVLHGPSGCGKSSLLKAGLLPRLASHIAAVFVEATPGGTEIRLLNALRRLLPDIPGELGLLEVLTGIRAGRWNAPRRKILIALDQFEQWLHAGNLAGPAPLIDALRQCDGENLQCLLLVREDFWTGISRFMQRLEIPLQEERNSTLVDRFDPIHARRVLAEFGRAFGRLPDNLEELDSSQAKFLDAAVEQLGEEGRVICVRLALFADLIKGKPWTRSALDQAGGAEGLGVTFLEDTFAAKSAPEAHRRHEQAVRKLFHKLLPEADSDIKGSMQSRAALLEACGYGSKPAAFDELITILDSQLRLVTPADPEGDGEIDDQQIQESATRTPYYQLTHDYLVPSLRKWLTRKQAEQMRGRAELRLADIAAEWGAKPDTKRLPTTWEYFGIRLLTNAASWNPKERMAMRAATRLHGRRWALILAVMVLVGALSWNFVSEQRNRTAESHRRQAELLVDNALVAPADALPYAARNIEPLREYALPALHQRFDDNRIDPARRLRAAVLLTQFGETRVPYLIDRLESADKRECSNVVGALKACGDAALGSVREMIERAESQQNWRLKARLALTLLQLGDAVTVQQMLELGSDPIQRVTLIDTIPQWHGSVVALVESIVNSESAAFRSGLLLGIGSIPADDLPPSDVEAATREMAIWYRNMPDAATHSAAGWALRRWQRPLPDLDVSVKHGRDWQVNSVGMTMVKVPPSGGTIATGQDVASTSLLRPFWLSDREISRGTFQMFMDDPSCPETAKPANWMGADLARSPSSEHPVQRVSWADAILFCNWLSRREHRNECYVWDGSFWQLVPGANGYRLPTEAEWEHGCRAGTTTEFFSGNDESFLGSYAVYLANQTAICGSKMPNPWGLFDVHGNVYEWCQDWYFPDKERVLRSGAFDYDSSKARSSNRQSNHMIYRSFTIGMRIARDGD